MPHRATFRVYYEDTDAGGVVYYANYLKFAERARTEALRAAGIDQGVLRAAHGLGFVVRRVEADYHAGARLDDLLAVTTDLTELGRARLRMRQAIGREGREEPPLVTLEITLACIRFTPDGFVPTRLPVEVREAFTQHFSLEGAD